MTFDYFNWNILPFLTVSMAIFGLKWRRVTHYNVFYHRQKFCCDMKEFHVFSSKTTFERKPVPLKDTFGLGAFDAFF